MNVLSKITWNAGAMLAPLPAVLVTTKSGERRDVMTAAWTGIVNTKPPKTYISVRKSRLTHEILTESRTFVINLTTEELAFAADFCGVRSGRDVDKFEKCALSTTPATKIDGLLLERSPVSVECRVTDVVELGSHDMFLADILCVDVNEELVDKEGRLALERAGLIAYVHGQYFTLGKKIGKFGWSVEKKKKGKGKASLHKKLTNKNPQNT